MVVLPELGERSGDFQKQPEPARSFGPHCAKAKCKYPPGAGSRGGKEAKATRGRLGLLCAGATLVIGCTRLRAADCCHLGPFWLGLVLSLLL